MTRSPMTPGRMTPGHLTSWRIAVPALFLAAAVTVVPVSPALACSCAAPPSDAASLQSSDAVFSGELVDRHEPGLLEGLGQQASSVPATFVFAVETVYKGRVARSQGVESARSGASCGLELPQGRRVLVFAEATNDGALTAGLCGGSRLLESAEVPFADGRDPRPGTAALPGGGGLPLAAVSLAGLAVVVLGGSAFLRRRRRIGPVQPG